ncbi:MAG: aminotransferase class I/II-fold pyridoxal phosphate-dependent enzyme [Pseudonocardiaceae bacterium]
MLSPLIGAISSRSARLRQRLEERGTVVIDASHGEMRFTMHSQVQAALLEDTRLLLAGKRELREPDGRLLDKSQPHVLRQLVADRLYHRWRMAGLAVTADEVLVCPYSSLAMLDAVLASVARPDGVILCPEGFYKSNVEHIEKLGLVIQLVPVDLDRDGRVDAWQLRRAIQTHREQLCALLLTMPGNPLVAVYTTEELHALGRVLVEEGIRVIIDAAFDGIVPDYQPLATVEVDIGGARHSLYERTVTITGLSKGHHAIGPYKIGAAITGDAGWRADICRQLAVPFQRETTVLARTVLEQTPEKFVRDNRATMSLRQAEARKLCMDLDRKFGFPAVIPVGSCSYGPFMTLRLADQVLQRAGVQDGWQLADFLLLGVGLETVAGPRMGIRETVVRVNVDAPRIGASKDPTLLAEVFGRLARLVGEVLDGGLTYQKALARIEEPGPVSVAEFPDVVPAGSATIAVLRESAPGERRVALTPSATAELVAAGMRVWVESGAGSGAGYSDAAYTRSGATVTGTRPDLFRAADVLCWVKPPVDLDGVLSQLSPGCMIIGLTHPLQDDVVAHRAQQGKLRLRSVELLAQEGILPAQDALAAMSRFAGRLSLQEALALRCRLGHEGQQGVLVIGAGQAGMEAAHLASALGHRLAVASTGQRRQRELEQLLGALYHRLDGESDLLGQQQVVARAIETHRPDIIIATAKHGSELAPCLLPTQTLDQLPGDTVIVDLNITRGGNVAGSRQDQQLRTDHGVWICHRSNYPSAEPAEASSAYAACLAQLLLTR